jgi:hypothetical protein
MTNIHQTAIQNKGKHAHEAYMNCEYKKAIKMFKEILADEDVDSDENYQIKSLIGLCYLALGELNKGWDYWRFRQQARKLIPVIEKILNLPLWDGDRLDGDLLLMAEDGIGDELYYSAVFALLLKYANKIYITCDERIKTLYEQTYPELFFIEKDDWPEIRKQARKCSAYGLIGDLPRYLDPELKHARNKKLVVNPVKFQEIREKLTVWGKNKKFIGISYKTSGNKPKIPKWEKIIWEYLTKISFKETEYPIVFVNLQENNLTKPENRGFLYKDPLVEMIDDIDLWNDFESIAALIECMDSIVTIDNYIAHLCGRLLKPTDLFLPKFTNVRWHYGDPDKYGWYPSITIHEEKNYEIKGVK